MSSSAVVQLNVLGQALIQHDLRADPWQDFTLLGERISASLIWGQRSAARSPKRRRAMGRFVRPWKRGAGVPVDPLQPGFPLSRE